jgi:pectate lyase
LDDSANKTIIGCGGHLVGNIMMENSSNIIIQNLTISSASPDNKIDLITIDNQSHHVWLDHLELADGGDGNLDMVHGSDYITVSFTKFIYNQLPAGGNVRDSDPGAHQFACLIGHDDKNAAEDTGHLKITIHHSFWADNIMERMPRIRYGQVHLLNNLYAASGGYTTTYAVRVGVNANVRSEHNVFKGINNPFDFEFSNPEAKVESIGDVFTNCTGTMDVTGKGPAFKPPYDYTADPVDSLEAKIRAGAGPR